MKEHPPPHGAETGPAGPTLETARLRLRPFRRADAGALARIYSNPHVTRYLPGGPYPAAEAPDRAQRVVRHFLVHWAQHGFGVWAVTRKEGGAHIGHCGLSYLPESPEVEVLYLLDEPYWGQGLATEAARASVRYGFQTLGLTRIVGVALPQNTASRRVLEKAGLLYEQEARFFNLDCVYYARTQPAQGLERQADDDAQGPGA